MQPILAGGEQTPSAKRLAEGVKIRVFLGEFDPFRQF
jgi:hypothetical protein